MYFSKFVCLDVGTVWLPLFVFCLHLWVWQATILLHSSSRCPKNLLICRRSASLSALGATTSAACSTAASGLCRCRPTPSTCQRSGRSQHQRSGRSQHRRQRSELTSRQHRSATPVSGSGWPCEDSSGILLANTFAIMMRPPWSETARIACTLRGLVLI